MNIDMAARKDIVDEMNDQPTEAHGHQVAKGGYQSFSSPEVRIKNKVISQYAQGMASPQPVANQFHYGMSESVAPSQAIKEDFEPGMQSGINAVAASILHRARATNTNKYKLYEQFKATDRDMCYEEIYVLGVDLGILNEKYDSVAGQWVVTMPYSNPRTAEEILYNQVGTSGKTAAELQDAMMRGYADYIAQKPQQTASTLRCVVSRTLSEQRITRGRRS